MNEVKAVLGRQGFRQLLIGQAISAVGDWMATVAFLVIVNELTGSGLAIGGILILRLAPGVIAGPMAGRIAEKIGHRRAMLSMDLARVGMAAAVPLLLGLWWIYLWAFLLEVAGLIFLPARDSAIPALVKKDQLPLANSMVLAASFGLIPVGAGAFALVAAFAPSGPATQSSVALVFFIDALTYLASWWYIRRIDALKDLEQQELEAREEEDDEEKAAFRDAIKLPMVRSLLPVIIGMTIAMGALFSLGVIFVRQVLEASRAQFGVLIVLFGVGGGIGMALLQRFRREWTFSHIRLGVALIGLGIFITTIATTIWLAFTGAVVFGAAAAFAMAAAMSLLQGRSEGRERTLAFTAFHVLMRGGLGIGAIVAGGAADIFGKLSIPLFGTTLPARYVIFASGLLVLATVPFIKDPASGREDMATREQEKEKEAESAA